MDKDFDKMMAMLDGKSPDEFARSQLNDTDRQQIDNAIEILFSGLSLQKWMEGGTLRDAWEKALDIVRDIVFEIRINNPATGYAREAVFAHRRKWHVKIIYAPHANETISCSEDKRDAWAESAETKIQNGLDMLRHKISEFETTDYAQHKKQESQNIVFQEIFNSRTMSEREHEHVREREK